MLGRVRALQRVATVQVHSPSAASASAVLMLTRLPSSPARARAILGLHATEERHAVVRPTAHKAQAVGGIAETPWAGCPGRACRLACVEHDLISRGSCRSHATLAVNCSGARRLGQSFRTTVKGRTGSTAGSAGRGPD